MFLTKQIAGGLAAMAASAGAGGPEDLGMAERGKAAEKAWAGVGAAIAWVRGLRAGREVWLRLSPAEAEALQALAEQAWKDSGGGCGLTATPIKHRRRALQKLAEARIAFDNDRLGRAQELPEPAPDVSRRKFGPLHP